MILKQRYQRPFSDLANDVENIIEHVFGDPGSHQSNWVPRSNVFETESEFIVELELPGIEPTAVDVELKEGSLEISGEKNLAEVIEGQQILNAERRSGTFSRSFKFSTQLDADKISASFKYGVLSVRLPKSEKVLPRKIEVQVAE